MTATIPRRNLITWQKYEDLLEEQFNTPLATTIASYINKTDKTDEEYDDEEFKTRIVPNPSSYSREIQLTSNFDCWVAHTSFNISENIQNIVNRSEGIEVLQICSRYRFFVGIGKLFDFTNVRVNIEKQIKEYLDAKSR